MAKAMKRVESEREQTALEQAEAPLRVVPVHNSGGPVIGMGIDALDRRLGGFEPGGVYLISGTPGPAKVVSVLQFLHAGLSKGERALLVSEMDAETILDMARAWGFALDRAWESGDLELIGVRDDFEMRVLRSAEPEDALEELNQLVPSDIQRIAVDPGSLFLQSGGRSLLGRKFLDWARRHPGTVCITLSVDSGEGLPSWAEWLVHATSGVLLFDRLPGGLYQVFVHRSIPELSDADAPVTLKLSPGIGLTEPDEAPARRSSDRPVGAADQVLMISLVETPATDIEAWARETFSTEIVTEPLEAVTALQSGSQPGTVLVLASRRNLREAVRACRALRPLTAAAIVFASDDAIRSTDRVNLLDAGADDCLSGGIDLRELTARIKQAVSAGGKLPASLELMDREGRAAPAGGLVGQGAFKEEATRRLSDPPQSVFGVVRFSSRNIPASELENLLLDRIRDEEGDLITRVPGGCLVLLQGARKDSVNAFLSRISGDLQDRMGSNWAEGVEAMVSASDGDKIDAILAQLHEADGSELA